MKSTSRQRVAEHQRGGGIVHQHARVAVERNDAVGRQVREPRELRPRLGQALESVEPRDRAHPEPQLDGIDGFADEIVRASLESPVPRRAVVQRGDHDDGNLGVSARTSQPATNLEPIQLRHHHVEKDDVWMLLLRQLQGGMTAVGKDNPVALLLEHTAEDFTADTGVVDNQHDRVDPYGSCHVQQHTLARPHRTSRTARVETSSYMVGYLLCRPNVRGEA